MVSASTRKEQANDEGSTNLAQLGLVLDMALHGPQFGFSMRKLTSCAAKNSRRGETVQKEKRKRVGQLPSTFYPMQPKPSHDTHLTPYLHLPVSSQLLQSSVLYSSAFLFFASGPLGIPSRLTLRS